MNWSTSLLVQLVPFRVLGLWNMNVQRLLVHVFGSLIILIQDFLMLWVRRFLSVLIAKCSVPRAEHGVFSFDDKWYEKDAIYNIVKFASKEYHGRVTHYDCTTHAARASDVDQDLVRPFRSQKILFQSQESDPGCAGIWYGVLLPLQRRIGVEFYSYFYHKTHLREHKLAGKCSSGT